METRNFGVRSGGATVTLAPAAPPPAAPAPATPPAATAAPTAATAKPQATPSTAAPVNGTQTLILKGIKLLRRPRAPLSVFINLPKGTAPQLNGPYYVGTLNLFNFDLGTGVVMNHSDDGGHAAHNAPVPEARFDVTEILQKQRAKGEWDGGAILVTVSTIGADSPGAITYITIDSISLVP